MGSFYIEILEVNFFALARRLFHDFFLFDLFIFYFLFVCSHKRFTHNTLHRLYKYKHNMHMHTTREIN